MIIWHGMWINSASPTYYRIRQNNKNTIIETRRGLTEEWMSYWLGNSVALVMGNWYGITHRYEHLEILP